MSIINTAIKSAYYQYVSMTMSIFSRYPIGTNVFDFDWDVLLILDTCRVDALQEVASDYEYIKEVNSITSVGSASSEWIANTFTQEYEEEIQDTIYVTANAYAERVLQDQIFPDTERGISISNWSTVTEDSLMGLDQVWKYAPDPPDGNTRPEHVSDRIISNYKEREPDRLIGHYSQPHPPYTAKAEKEDRDLYEYEKNPWNYLKDGGDISPVWDAYIANLHMVLEEVETVLNNIDAETVVISADHGEAFGEWGIYWHPIGVPHPKLKRVPWVETTAVDHGEYEPQLQTSQRTKHVEDHLRDLGYI